MKGLKIEKVWSAGGGFILPSKLAHTYKTNKTRFVATSPVFLVFHFEHKRVNTRTYYTIWIIRRLKLTKHLNQEIC